MRTNKKAECIKLIRINPNPTEQQIRDMADMVVCSERTVYRALAEVRKANGLTNKLTPSSLPAENSPKPKKSVSAPKIKLSKKEKKGSLDIPDSFMPKHAIPRIKKDEDFVKFCKLHAFPYYRGLYRWQEDWFRKVWPYKYSETLVPRDHGKSIGHNNLCQWAMTAKSYDILYLGWTTRRKQIAQFVYDFFKVRKELVIEKNSYQHFRTTYGTKFDTYSVKSKEVLGMHEIGELDREITEENEYLRDYVRDESRPLLLIIDDAIDNSFRKERWKEESLEEFFTSTIISINPNKMMIVGTKKFEDDFYQFVQDVFGKDMITYVKTPYLAEDDPRYGKEKDNPCNLLCPERWIDENHPQYSHYLALKQLESEQEDSVYTFSKLDKELVKRKDLTVKRKQVGEYWWSAEYCQDPHPILGEVWKEVVFQDHKESLAYYDLCLLSIDRATTKGPNSDYTGRTEFFRRMPGDHIQKTQIDGKLVDKTVQDPAYYIVTNDWTNKIDLYDLILWIDEWYANCLAEFGRVLEVIIVVEKQGGGDDLISMAKSMGKPWSGENILFPVHNTVDKETRIKDILRTPINNGYIRFLTALRNSELVVEILSFPHSIYFDAVDSLANGFQEAESNPSLKIDVQKLKSIIMGHANRTRRDELVILAQKHLGNRRGLF